MNSVEATMTTTVRRKASNESASIISAITAVARVCMRCPTTIDRKADSTMMPRPPSCTSTSSTPCPKGV
jgi:hypothetical protein